MSIPFKELGIDFSDSSHFSEIFAIEEYLYKVCLQQTR